MELIKYTHSCVRLENEGRVLVIDPGNFSGPEELAQALDGADVLLVTHVHPDHLDAEPVQEHLRAHPEVQVHAPAPVAAGLREALARTAPSTTPSPRRCSSWRASRCGPSAASTR